MMVLGIAASARRHGNSETLLDKALAGAASEGAQVEKIVLNELDIAPCQECARCDSGISCYIKDDMQMLYPKLLTADAIIISSPVYFGSIPAQLKAMIDRCQLLWIRYYKRGKKRPRPTRKGLFICVSGHNNMRFFNNSRQIVNIFFSVIGVTVAYRLYVPCMESSKDVLKEKEKTGEAFRYGVELVSPEMVKRK